MTPPAPAQATQHIEAAWYSYMDDRNLKAKIPAWRSLAASDGTPLLSVEVVGPGAANALSRFIKEGRIGLPTPGDTRPAVDYSVPGRLAYVWRCHGVWVELWLPESQASLPEVTPVPVRSNPVRAALRGLGDRLPTTRRKKETTTA